MRWSFPDYNIWLHNHVLKQTCEINYTRCKQTAAFIMKFWSLYSVLCSELKERVWFQNFLGNKQHMKYKQNVSFNRLLCLGQNLRIKTMEWRLSMDKTCVTHVFILLRHKSGSWIYLDSTNGNKSVEDCKIQTNKVKVSVYSHFPVAYLCFHFFGRDFAIFNN